MIGSFLTFLERYADYKASWGRPLSPDDQALLFEAFSMFLLDEASTSVAAAERARSLIADLRNVRTGWEGGKELAELRSQIDALEQQLVRAKRASRIGFEHALSLAEQLKLPQGMQSSV